MKIKLNMRILLVLFSLLNHYAMYSQSARSNYFDPENAGDHYKKSLAGLKEEKLKGNVRELKKSSEKGVYLHLKLDKKGSIIEEREYSDTVNLSRIISFKNGKVVREILYQGNDPARISYAYDKKGKLVTRTITDDNKKTVSSVKYFYDDKEQRIREEGEKRMVRFIHEGDTLLWRLVYNEDSLLVEAGSILKSPKDHSELITWYKPVVVSTHNFKDRIKPQREILQRWNEEGMPVENAEFLYDSLDNKVVQSIIRQEYAEGHVRMKSAIHNTDMLKGKFVTTYIYNDKGLLETQLFRDENHPEKRIQYQYDEHGNVISDGGFSYQYVYDTHDNWIIRKMLKNGNWITVERREIIYYK